MTEMCTHLDDDDDEVDDTILMEVIMMKILTILTHILLA